MRLDVRVRHGPEHRNIEQLGRKHGGGTGKSGNVACARRHQSGLGAVGAPNAEIDKELARRGKHLRAALEAMSV